MTSETSGRARRPPWAALVLALAAVPGCGGASWEALNEAAKTAHADERMQEAEELFRQALEEAERDPREERLVKSLNNMGEFYRSVGRLDEAEPYYLRALETRAEQLPEDDPELARNYANMALVYRLLRRHDLEAEMYRRALEVHERVDPVSIEAGDCLNNLGIALFDQGKLDEAQQAMERSLEIWRELLLADSPKIGAALNNLAHLHKQRGELAESARLYERSLEIWRRNRGPQDPEVARCLANLGEVYRLQERFEQAERTFREALQIREKALGAESSLTAQSLNSLGLVCRQQGRSREAETYYRRAAKILDRPDEPPTHDLAATLFNLAVLYMGQQRYEDAEPVLKRAVEILEQRQFKGGALSMLALQTYADLLRRTDRDAEADAVSARLAAPGAG